MVLRYERNLMSESHRRKSKRASRAPFRARELPTVRGVTFVLFAIFFVSGASGLVHQVVWIRSLEFSLGSSTAAVATVLAAFMAGLAFGSGYLGSVFDRRRARALTIYAFLQFGIGVSALLVPLGVRGASAVYYMFYGPGGPTSMAVVLRVAGVFLLLIVPTMLMGATFPVMVRAAVRLCRTRASQRLIGGLYGVNTLGAVLGVFLAGFVLLRYLGTSSTSLVAVLMNVVAGAAALVLVRTGGRAADEDASEQSSASDAKAEAGPRIPSWGIYAATFLAGFSALACEVVWGRVLRLMLASSIFSVSAMLMAFLIGIGAGSLIVSSRRRETPFAVPFLLIGFGATAALAIPLIFESAKIFQGIVGTLAPPGQGPTWGQIFVGRLGLSSAIMFVPAALSGALFPILLAAAAGRTGRAGSSHDASGGKPRRGLGGRIGAVYAANTAGAVLGSLLAGFVLIPAVGTKGTVLISAILLVGFGGFLLLTAMRPRRVTRVGLSYAAMAVGVAVLIVAASSHRGEYYLGKIEKGAGTTTLYYKEEIGASIIVVEDTDTGVRRLYTNGTFAMDTSMGALQTAGFLGHLPAILAERRDSALVIGLGMGTTLAAVASHPFKEITVVEIAPGVFDVADVFAEYNYDVLKDSRVRGVIEDGRSYVIGTDKTFDVISCDPIHPAVASPALYTKDYYELCRSRLAAGGVMVQYLPLHQLSSSDFRVLLRTFSSVFPESAVFMASQHGVLVGGPNGVTTTLANLETIFEPALSRGSSGTHEGSDSRVPTAGELLKSVGLYSPAKIVSCLVLDSAAIREFVGDGPINTDDHALLEFSESRSFGRDTRPENLEALLAARPDFASILEDPPSTWPDAFGAELDRAIEGRRHLLLSSLHLYEGNMNAALEEIWIADRILPDDPEVSHLGGSALVMAYVRKASEDYQRWMGLSSQGGADPDELRGVLERAEASLLRADDLAPGDPQVARGLEMIRSELEGQ
ncbi:MAG: fused MFS/spermidine synthase [Candidatus Eisenbacteria bacterium]